MGFQEANVDAYSWATKVMIGLIRMVPEQVEAGFLAFLLSRIIGVMKEDFWYRLPKSTVLRPSPIHWGRRPRTGGGGDRLKGTISSPSGG